MRIKKFEGETLQEALAKVKRDFGPEAVILHTKKYKKGGFLGIFGKEIAEVTAGIDINIERTKERQVISEQQPARVFSDSFFTIKQSNNLTSYKKAEDMSFKNESLARELNEGRVFSNTNLRAYKENTVYQRNGFALKNGMGKIHKLLIENGVEESIVFRTLQNINSQLSDTQINNKEYLEQYLFEYIASLIQVSGPIKLSKGMTKIVAFIGPTGVGKTTTLAKLAAKFALIENKNVVLVSCDTYRIAADLQLKKYGEIMGIPVEIVMTPNDFKKVINKHIDKDLILFDTAGRSPRNKKHLIELKEFIEAYSPIETHLVLSAVTKYYDAISIINNFGLVPIHRILFTKLDETKNYGLLLNLSISSGGIPISYVTTGQTVPDDIELADSKVISRLVIKGDFETWIKQRN